MAVSQEGDREGFLQARASHETVVEMVTGMRPSWYAQTEATVRGLGMNISQETSVYWMMVGAYRFR
jgi:hypothetical protein